MSGEAQFVVGLIGQICAGKSAVAEAFRKRGAMIYDADKSVHEMYRTAEVIEQVRNLFGDSVISAQGQVDRRALGRIVFADAEKLKLLTGKVIFPRTEKAMAREIEKLRHSNAPALVLDAPTLVEAGRKALCDYLLFVAAPRSRRQEWAKKRGWDADELERRESRMMNEELKRKGASAILENSGTLEDLERQAGLLFDKWSGRIHLN